jgi:hypothetical protein
MEALSGRLSSEEHFRAFGEHFLVDAELLTGNIGSGRPWAGNCGRNRAGLRNGALGGLWAWQM